MSASGSGASPDAAPPFPPRPSLPRPFAAAAADLVASAVAFATLGGGGGRPGSLRFVSVSPGVSQGAGRAGAALGVRPLVKPRQDRAGPAGPEVLREVTDLFYPRGRRAKKSGQAL